MEDALHLLPNSNCLSSSFRQGFRCHKEEHACVLSDNLLPDQAVLLLWVFQIPILTAFWKEVARDPSFSPCNHVSGNDSFWQSPAPFHGLLLSFTDLKNPVGMCQPHSFLIKPQWLAKPRSPSVSAGALVWKQPPPTNVCTCLWLIGNLLTVTTSRLPFRGWRARAYQQRANCGC